MQVGDLVKHKKNNVFGTVIEVRKSTRTKKVNSCIIAWTDGWVMMHPYSQLEVL